MTTSQQDIKTRLAAHIDAGWRSTADHELVRAALARIELLELQLAEAKVLPERDSDRHHGAVPTCKTCGGSGVVDDGEIDCFPNGTLYENGPVKCVKDCPQCKGSAIESTRKG